MPMLYCCLRCGDLRSPGVTELRNGPLGLRDDDDDHDGLSATQVTVLDPPTNVRGVRHW